MPRLRERDCIHQNGEGEDDASGSGFGVLHSGQRAEYLRHDGRDRPAWPGAGLGRPRNTDADRMAEAFIKAAIALRMEDTQYEALGPNNVMQGYHERFMALPDQPITHEGGNVA